MFCIWLWLNSEDDIFAKIGGIILHYNLCLSFHKNTWRPIHGDGGVKNVINCIFQIPDPLFAPKKSKKSRPVCTGGISVVLRAALSRRPGSLCAFCAARWTVLPLVAGAAPVLFRHSLLDLSGLYCKAKEPIYQNNLVLSASWIFHFCRQQCCSAKMLI